MPKNRILNARDLARALKAIELDLNVVIAALEGLPPVPIYLGALAGAGGRRIGQVLVGRQCTGNVSIKRPSRPADRLRKPPNRRPA